ncbi:hypothetical protein [Rhizobium sp. 768_B6_N1_8]|uniref:hypothetical protein n=1 Tax=unclassified Rhizobium TaxID=2613769 RepID=UPI003F1F6DE6
MASLRVLCQLDFPSKTVRLWDGSGGPFIDQDGNRWRACTLKDDALDNIELAINAEAFMLPLTLSEIDTETYTTIWTDFEAGEIIGTRVQIMLLYLDDLEQPVGAPEIKFTGAIDDVIFDRAASDDGIMAFVTIEITNRFSLRTLTNGSVLSDVDQKARSKVLNPAGAPDRFCERIPLLIDKTIAWPNWTV